MEFNPNKLPSFHYIALALFLLCSWHQLAAQTSSAIYSNNGGEVTTTRSSLLLGPSFKNLQNASTPNLQDYALISPSVSSVLTTASIKMPLSGKAEAGYRAGVLVAQNNTIANVDLLSGATIKTYLNGYSQEAVPVAANVLAAALLSGPTSPVQVEFVATKEFDAVELVLTIPAGLSLNLGDGIRVYYAYAVKRNVLEEANGYLSRFKPASEDHFSTSSRDSEGLVVCVNSNVHAPLNAVDYDLKNYATFSSLLTVNCPTTLRVQLEGTAPANYRAGFMVEASGLLDVSALEALTITTYLNGIKQESAAGADLLKVNVLPSNKQYISFATTKAFNYVEIRRNSLLDALVNLRIYYGFGLEEAAFSGTKRIFSNFSSPVRGSEYITSQSSLICVNDCDGFTSPEKAADSHLQTSYSTLSGLTSVAATRSLRLRLTQSGEAGNRAGIVCSLNQGLISADLLANITISTYAQDGITLLESAKGNDLVSLSLLNSSQNEIFFYSTQDFGWVEITLQGGVSVLENTSVYYAFADDRPIGAPLNIVPPILLPVKLISFTGKSTTQGNTLIWETASELNSSHFVVERSHDAKTGFVAVGSVRSAGNSRIKQKYTFNDVQADGSTSYYYRLRQVDFDGTEEFSKIIYLPAKQNSFVKLVLYPNPAPKAVSVQINAGAVPVQSILLYNAAGRLIWQTQLPQGAANIATADLSPGLYIVVARGKQGNILSTERLVIY